MPASSARRVEDVADERGEPRVVSSSISARNDSRCSGVSVRQRWRSVAAQPTTDAIGPRSSCETSETKSARRAERRRSSSAAARSASNARMFSTAVASWRPSSVSEVDLVLRERVRIAPGDGDHAERACPARESGAATRERMPIAGKLELLVGVVRRLVHVVVHESSGRRAALARARLSLERPRSIRSAAARPPRARRRRSTRARPRSARIERDPVEREATSGAPGRRAGRPPSCSSDDARARAQRLAISSWSAWRPISSRSCLGLGGAGLRAGRLAVELAHEPADDEAGDQLDAERERDVADLERVVGPGAASARAVLDAATSSGALRTVRPTPPATP